MTKKSSVVDTFEMVLDGNRMSFINHGIIVKVNNKNSKKKSKKGK